MGDDGIPLAGPVISTRERDGAEPADERVDRALLSLLLAGAGSGAFSESELAMESGEPNAANDALARLEACGLIHRRCGLVIASRAALELNRLGI